VRAALQALRATHVAEIKRREKEVEAMRERWSKLADAQLKLGALPSGMKVISGSGSGSSTNANAMMIPEGERERRRGGIVEEALEEAEKACKGLREENAELKALVVDSANAVRKILHRAVSSDPDGLEFVRAPSPSFFSQLKDMHM
jgi:hypothetical protein